MMLLGRVSDPGVGSPQALRDVGCGSLYWPGGAVEELLGLAGSLLGSRGMGSSVLWSLWVPLNPV